MISQLAEGLQTFVVSALAPTFNDIVQETLKSHLFDRAELTQLQSELNLLQTALIKSKAETFTELSEELKAVESPSLDAVLSGIFRGVMTHAMSAVQPDESKDNLQNQLSNAFVPKIRTGLLAFIGATIAALSQK